MRVCKSALVTVLIVSALIVLTSAFTPRAAAQTENTIFTFGETTTGGFWPQDTLLEDSAGNFYGTARGGGAYGVGDVFELSPPAVAGGAWTLTTLYNFIPYGNGGYVPLGGLVRDQKGSFYGTFYAGGDPVCNCGGVYKLNAPTVQGGAWVEVPIYYFKGGSADGQIPVIYSLALTTTGTLYGTTITGGTYNSGVLYQLTTKNGTTYTESVLYSFGATGDAATPNGPILLDSKGALYGAAASGGAFNLGALFKYVPAANGQLPVESLLYSFGGSSTTGASPAGNLSFDASGNLYGVTTLGGTNTFGVVYELSPASPTWTESVLFAFTLDTGGLPLAGITWNHANNNIYGTTSALNMHPAGDGSVYKLVPPAKKGGAWTETTEFQFTYRVNGGYPTGAPTLETKTGYLYGTAENGGIEGCDLFCGTIWQITNP